MFKPHTLITCFLSLVTCHLSLAKVIPPSVPLSENIQSLTVIAGDRWQDMPVIKLDGREVINIDFDDMTHQYHRYTYTLQHCDSDWKPSDQLLPSEYLKGFPSGNTIDNIQESINTTFLYTHYNIQIPNNSCEPTISGNYSLTVIDEDQDDSPVLQAFFMIVQPEMTLSLDVSPNTDLDNRESHQQLSMTLQFNHQHVTHPEEQIHAVVVQNANVHTAVIDPSPQSVRHDALQWSHSSDLIFPATNEYRKFEILDPHLPALGIDSIMWDGEAYHAYATPCEPRPSYIFDKDADGAYLIRNQYFDSPEYLADYFYVHYTLVIPPYSSAEFGQDIYVGGRFTQNQILPKYKMSYDNLTRTYQATILQKQGYYNYCFLTTPSGELVHSLPTEGNYFQTSNTYDVFIYYRPIGGRTDLLVAHGQIRT